MYEEDNNSLDHQEGLQLSEFDFVFPQSSPSFQGSEVVSIGQYSYNHRHLRKRQKKVKPHSDRSLSKENKKKRPIREVKGFLVLKEIENAFLQFKRMMEMKKKYIYEDVLQSQYKHSAQKKSWKYLIHLWYNLIHKNLQQDLKKFCQKIAIPEIINTLHDRYKNRTKSVIKKLQEQILRVFKQLLNYDGDIEKTINNIYENYGQHEKKSAEATRCLQRLKQMFQVPRTSQGDLEPQLI